MWQAPGARWSGDRGSSPGPANDSGVMAWFYGGAIGSIRRSMPSLAEESGAQPVQSTTWMLRHRRILLALRSVLEQEQRD